MGTMKISTGVLALLLFTLASSAQTQKPKPAPAMSDEFAKAGIKALRAIQSDGHSVGINGEVSAKVAAIIDDADAVAREKETSLVTTLRLLQFKQEMNNLNLEAKKTLFEAGFHPKAELFRDIELEEAWSKAPEHIALLNTKDFTQVADCEAGLESLLRGRRIGPIPQACQ
jgi:hypothetical protein